MESYSAQSESERLHEPRIHPFDLAAESSDVLGRGSNIIAEGIDPECRLNSPVEDVDAQGESIRLYEMSDL